MQSKLITELNDLALENRLNIDTFKEDNTIVICGAGISMESSLPSGFELMDCVLSTFGLVKPKNQDDINQLSYVIDLILEFGNYNEQVISKIKGFKVTLYDFPRLEVLFKCLKDVLSKDDYSKAVQSFLFYNYKKGSFNKTVFSSYHHFAIADFIKNGGIVLTANFDNLIEHALTELNFELNENIVVFPLTKEILLDKTKGSLIKYHGDINIIESIGIDISNLRINGFNNFETSLLDSILCTTKNIIFIGFSVSDTLDLIPYLKQQNTEINYIFLKWTNSGEYMLQEFQRNLSLKKLEAFEYFLNNFSNSYILNNVNNEIQRRCSEFNISKNPAIILSESKIEELQNFKSILSNQETQLNKIIKLNVLKSYGLLNRIDNKIFDQYLCEIPISWKIIFKNYKENINGKYKSNLINLLEDKNQQDFEFKKFGALQEYIFLQKGFIIDRIFSFFKLLTLFLKFQRKLIFVKDDNNQELKLNRSISLFYLRFFQGFSKSKILKLAVPNFLLRKYEKLILRQISLSKELNDLSTFRFGLKEHLYIKGLFNHFFKKSKNELVEELVHIFELNIDTNYFIEANNLLRFGATVIDPVFFEEPFIISTKLTNDQLNSDKVTIIIKK